MKKQVAKRWLPRRGYKSEGIPEISRKFCIAFGILIHRSRLIVFH